MQKDKNGACRLCLKQSVLRNSHILPEFLYTDIYDENHRGVIVSNKKDKVFQKGVREYLLCQECETKFSRYEKYAKKVIENIPKFSHDTSKRLFCSDNINYAYFKLFQLSILWRASISTEEAFNQIQLGPHEEVIRNMLDNDEPGKASGYGCIMSIVPNTELLHQIILSPVRIKKKFYGHTTYVFVTGNLKWMFVITRNRTPLGVQEFFLQEDGRLQVLISKQDEKSELIKVAQIFEKMSKNKPYFEN